MRTEIVFNLPEAEYRAHPGVSVSELKRLIGGVPAECKAYREEKKEPTPAMIFGTLCHLAVLEPQRFNTSHFVKPEGLDGRTKEGKEWIAAHSDKPVIPAKGAMSRDAIDGMMASIAAMPEAARILKWKGNNEVSIFAKDEATGLQIKGRCDRLSEDDDGRPVIVDFKTSAEPESFERAAASLNYHLQDQFYTKLMQAHGSVPLFAFLVTGTASPYTVRVGVLDAEAKSKGAEEVDRLLALYLACAKTDHWPAYKVDNTGRRTGMETFTLPRWIHTQPAPV